LAENNSGRRGASHERRGAYGVFSDYELSHMGAAARGYGRRGGPYDFWAETPFRLQKITEFFLCQLRLTKF